MGYISSFILMIYLQSRREFTQLSCTGDAVGSLRVGVHKPSTSRALFRSRSEPLAPRPASVSWVGISDGLHPHMTFHSSFYYAPENAVKSVDLTETVFRRDLRHAVVSARDLLAGALAC